MNVIMSVFTCRNKSKWYSGAHFVNPDTEDNEFIASMGDDEEDALVNLVGVMDSLYDEMGLIQFVISVTNTPYFNFACTGKARELMPEATKLLPALKAFAKPRGTKFKKNELPDMENVVSISYADMMARQMISKYEIDGSTSLHYNDTKTLKGMKRAYKKTPNIFPAKKVFFWGETEEVEIEGDISHVYYSGNITSSNADTKKDKKIADVEKKIRERLYAYYTGSNNKLTDAGSKQTEEVRAITLLKERNPLVEAFFDLQRSKLSELPIEVITMGNIDKIVSGAPSYRLMEKDNHWFSFNQDSKDIVFNGVTRSDVSYVFYPVRLGMQVRESFLTLRDKFIDHLNGKLIGEEYDITDVFFTYEPNAKGVTVCTPTEILNGKFVSAPLPRIEFDGERFKPNYIFTTDCPSAGELKRLAPHNPKMSLVCENLSNTTILFRTIIRTDIGVSIYSCYEGSRTLRRKKR